MLYQEYESIVSKEAQLQRDLQCIAAKKLRLEQTPEFKDAKIKALEEEITRLKKKLEPYERMETQKRIDDYGNMKCTNKIGCYCRDCHDL